jgi:arylsulfatase A-like enzyme/tetratricopeptide (TPR) repeat protein
MTIYRRFLWALLVTGVCSATLVGSETAKPANVILITLDTTRADRMGFLGSRLGLTPNLDEFARQGAIFSKAYAHVPLTTPSHATILTGTYPQFNHLGDLGTALAKDLPYLPDVLHSRGYTTAAVVGSQVLDPRSATAPGFERGFDNYDAGFHSRRAGEERYTSEERRATTVVNHALAWLKKQPHSPFFLWVHLYDPHDPYEPPEPFKSKYQTAPYDGEIAYVDSAIGKLFSGLKTLGLYDSPVIAIVADHGEALGEHGEESHGFFLYDETIHVPLMIRLPMARGAGLQVDKPVGLVDIAPTLLQAIGAEVPNSMQGKSLLPLMTGKKGDSAADVEADHGAYAETDYPIRAFGWSWLRSWRAGKYLYVDAPHRELYDESTDPKAVHNLADTHATVADTLQAQLEEFRSRTRRQGGVKAANLTPQLAEKLQALGYLTAASNATNEHVKQRGADPKNGIEIANLLHHALLAVDDDQYQVAIPQLERVLKAEPSLAVANQEMGRALNGLEKYAEAIPYLQKAVELNPQSGRAHLELGTALGSTGNWAGSAKQFEAAVSRVPESDDLHFFLGVAYDNLGRASDAEKTFREALKINPNHFSANLFLGRLLGMQNNPSAALPFLQKAVKLQPQSPDAHAFLANVYIELGQTENAHREKTEAEQLGAAGRR